MGKLVCLGVKGLNPVLILMDSYCLKCETVSRVPEESLETHSFLTYWISESGSE